MKTTVETVDPTTVKLTVEVEPARVKKAFDRAARELAKQVSLPGFRPGKAPRRLIEQRLGTGVIAQQAMEDSLTSYYVEALEKEEIDAVAMPEIDMQHFDEKDGCAFEATIQIRPEFDVPPHEGISVTFPEWDVKDEDVEQQIQTMRERFAEVDEVDRPAETGDYVTLDLEVEVGGEVLEDAAVEDAMYEVGSEGVTPKLDEEIVGKEAGDTFTYTDELPEDYPEHGGEEATFNVTVKDVRAKTLPDLDDDFAMTASEHDTLEELRKEIRDSLLRRRVLQAQHDVRGRIVEAYLAKIDIPLPEAMVEEERDARIRQVERQAEQYGLEVDQLLQMEGTDRESFESNAETQARQAVKARLVLEALAEELELQVDADDLNEEVHRHAQNMGVPPQQIAQAIQEQGSMGALVGDVLRRKAIDAIADAAEIEGAPSDDVMIELGLMADPDGEEAGEDDDAEGGIIVPGQQAAGEQQTDSGLIVPGT
ncbi:MAG: trigger factor [Nitriliruptorales bacterium]|nr:trigger factor [Nitriliruptorales bacterium]